MWWAAAPMVSARCVDLKFHADGFHRLDAAHRTVKCAGFIAKIVMALGVLAVNADADAPDAAFDHFSRDNVIDQRAVGCHNHAQPLAGSISGNLKNIGAQKRLTACEDNHRL